MRFRYSFLDPRASLIPSPSSSLRPLSHLPLPSRSARASGAKVLDSRFSPVASPALGRAPGGGMRESQPGGPRSGPHWAPMTRPPVGPRKT
eukprot:7289276-Pyramimonas_sp.AAC.1